MFYLFFLNTNIVSYCFSFLKRDSFQILQGIWREQMCIIYLSGICRVNKLIKLMPKEEELTNVDLFMILVEI